MQEIKDISNTAINQAKFIADNIKDNVVAFQKKSIQQNPFNSMQWHWQVAQMRKNFVFFCTLPFVISESYWKTFQEVYTPEGKE